MIHIYPINDTKEHEMSTTCKCDPTVEIQYGEDIVIHNSFDGQEGVELANEILKPKI